LKNAINLPVGVAQIVVLLVSTNKKRFPALVAVNFFDFPLSTPPFFLKLGFKVFFYMAVGERPSLCQQP